MNEELLGKILKCPRLPSMPAIALQVIALCKRPDVHIKDIAKAISNDPALATRILRTVNSSYYGLGKTVSTVSNALIILGLNAVKTLALGFSLVSDLQSRFGSGTGANDFWQRSIYSAVAARAIGERAKLEDPEEAFLGGLLQDIGILGFVQIVGDPYTEILQEAGSDHRKLWCLERERYQLDHMAVGAGLAEQWRLPKALVEPIRYHEHPKKAYQGLESLTWAVSLGGQAADVFLAGDRKEALDIFYANAWQWFDIDKMVANELLSSILDCTKEMSELFNVNFTGGEDIDEILAEANETLEHLTFQTQMNERKLEEKNKQLEERVTRDSLTGTANRLCLDEFLAEQFAISVKSQRPLSVVFLDADNFKTINDTYGHMVGDRVLLSLANLLKNYTPAEGLLARYGGEEFVMVLPQMARRNATWLAEEIRVSMSETTIEVGEDLSLNMTISLGVVAFDGRNFFQRPGQLLRAADQAVYAAKASGRNCVRVFSPRSAAPQPISG